MQDKGTASVPELGLPREYVVKPGDTLSKIAETELKNYRRVDDIYALNREVISGKDQIIPGQSIKLPAPKKEDVNAYLGQQIEELKANVAKKWDQLVGASSKDKAANLPTANPCLGEETSSDSSGKVIAECTENIPCCMVSLDMKCSHETKAELPLLVENKGKSLYLVASDLPGSGQQGGGLFSGKCQDPMEFTIESKPCKTGKIEKTFSKPYPVVLLKGDGRSQLVESGNKIDLLTKDVSVEDGLLYFLDNFLFLNKTSSNLVNKYSLVTKACTQGEAFSTDIYVYPKLKWSGSLSFGYDLDTIKISRPARKTFEKNKNKAIEKATGVKPKNNTKAIMKQANIHEFSATGSLDYWIANEAYNHSITSNWSRVTNGEPASKSSKGGGNSSKLTKYLKRLKGAKTALGKKMNADPKSWDENLQMIGPQIAISGYEQIVESHSDSGPLHEAEIAIDAIIGFSGSFDILSAALEGLMKAPHPGVRAAATAAEKVKEGLLSGAAYSHTYNAGVKGEFGIILTIGLTAGSQSSGVADTDPMLLFNKALGADEWDFKSASFSLELSVKVVAFADVTLGYVTGKTDLAIEGGGASKISVKLKIEGSGNKKVCKLYFYFNGLKMFYSVKANYDTGREKGKGEKKNTGKAKQQGYLNQYDKDGRNAKNSSEIKKKEEFQLIEPFHWPSAAGVELFSFGG